MSIPEAPKKNATKVGSCDAKRGFFTLYDCGKPAPAQCSACKRNLCSEHFPKGISRCVECAAKAKMSSQFANSDKAEIEAEARSSYHDLMVAYRNRETQLKKNKGSSIYLGKNLGAYYQHFDIRSFDIELSSIADMSDSPDEVFFDS